MNAVRITRQLSIPEDEFRFQFTRSSGPGGQHVNKTNTRVTLRWSVRDSPSLSEAARSRLLQRLKSRLTEEGELVIHSQRGRSQLRNREDCLQRLREWVSSALAPRKRRVPTKPTAASKRRRLDEKRRRSQVKESRRQPPD